MLTKKKSTHVEEVQQPLFYDPQRDYNPYWSSSLFSDVYLKNDLPLVHKQLWENDEVGGFYNFFNGFKNLVLELEHEPFDRWKEADTVKNWIIPVMELLGWEEHSKGNQTSCMDNQSFTVFEDGKQKVYRPDILYFNKPQDKAYTQSQTDVNAKLREARDRVSGAKIVIEAKYWNRLESRTEESSRSSKSLDTVKGLSPEDQTLKYMEIFQHDFGILTDGKVWKLFHKELSPGTVKRSFNFDLGDLRQLVLTGLNTQEGEQKFLQNSKYFYYFFSKESLCKKDESSTEPLAYQILEYSKKYAGSIEEDLKKRFIVTMGIACNALRENLSKKSLDENDIELLRNVAESHLFNILFTKSCEVRRILPINSTNYLKISLHEVVETLDYMRLDPVKDWDSYLPYFKAKSTFGGKAFDYNGHQLFDRFINLYEIIHDGTAQSKDFGFEIEGFKESIFSKDEWRFAKKAKISNREMIRIIFNLNFTESAFPQRKYQQIPYNFFTPRQLGSIYESFLEFELMEAESDLIFKNGEWQKANLSSNKVKELKILDTFIVRKNELYFAPESDERKATGAFYTPDHIVKYMLKNSLDQMTESLSSAQILDLKICDPTMGSGHFLSSVLENLTQTYRKKLSDEINDDVTEPHSISARKILQNCIYGVDIKYRAVKLGKMSLWLTSAYPGVKLEHLDDQLKVGDSLVFEKLSENHQPIDFKKEFPEVFKKKNGFDLVIGNPPWVSFGLRGVGKLTIDLKDWLKDNYPGSAQYKISYYACFMERGLQLINPKGSFTFIVPDSFLLGLYFSNIRNTILKNSHINSLTLVNADFWGTSVCTGMNVIFSVSGKECKKENKIKLSYFAGGEELRLGKGKTGFIGCDYYKSTPNNQFRMFFDQKEVELVEKLETESEYKLGDFIKFSSGLIAKGKKEDIISSRANNKNYHKAIISGEVVMKNGISKAEWFINFDQNALKSGFKDARYFEDKLLVRQTADGIIASLDQDHLLCLNNVHVGNLKPGKDKDMLWYIYGIMNTDLYDKYYKLITLEDGRAMAQVDISTLHDMALPFSSKNFDKIVALSKELGKAKKDQISGILKKIEKLAFNFIEVELFADKKAG